MDIKLNVVPVLHMPVQAEYLAGNFQSVLVRIRQMSAWDRPLVELDLVVQDLERMLVVGLHFIVDLIAMPLRHMVVIIQLMTEGVVGVRMVIARPVLQNV